MWGRGFVRGESSDTHTKGEKYEMKPTTPISRGMGRMGGRKRPVDDDDDDDDDDAYFDDSDDEKKPAGGSTLEDDPLDAYMASLEGRDAATAPAPAKRRRFAPPTMAPAPAEAEEVDPLDAYMAGLAEAKPAAPKAASKAVQQCDEESDPAMAYMEMREQRRAEQAARGDGSDEEGAGDDEDGMGSSERVGGPRKQLKDQKGMALLEEIDHDAIEYAPFVKELYRPHPTIREMSDEEVGRYREELGVATSGFDVPRPIRLFEHAGFEPSLLRGIKRLGYETPTPIQCVALPAAMSGRDLIGIAATGSGKTAAYVLPMVRHIMEQPELGRDEGPIGLVLVPTHELAEQVTLAALPPCRPAALPPCRPAALPTTSWRSR